MSKIIKSGVALSDLHVGSRAGLWKPGIRLSTGSIHQLNKGQGYLWECYEDALAHLPRRLDFLILAGDIVNGPNTKETGVGNQEPDEAWQVAAAYSIIEPLEKRVMRDQGGFIVEAGGTPYHAGKASQWEEVLGILLNTKTGEMGAHAEPWWNFRVGGVVFDVAHHLSHFIAYPATPLNREIQFSDFAADVKGTKTDVILRGHVHRMMLLNFEGQIAIACPAMSIQTGFAKRSKTPNRLLSRYIGITKIDILEDDDYTKRTGRVRVEFLHYAHPKLEVFDFG